MAEQGRTASGSTSSSVDSAYPPQLREAEKERVAERRRNAGLGDSDGAKGRVGLAISGGGIRSATFSLGVLQVLAKRDLLKKLDFMSTVSGGGYIGSFLGRLYSRPESERGPVEDYLKPDGVPTRQIRPVQWLKDNGEYMAPGGGGDLLALASSALRNLVAFHVVIGTGLLLLLLAIQLPWLVAAMCPAATAFLDGLPRFGVWLQNHVSCDLVPSRYLDLLPLAPLLVVPPGWAYWLIERERRSSLDPLVGFCIVVAGAAALTTAWSLMGPATEATTVARGCFYDASEAASTPIALAVPSAVLGFGLLSWLVWAEAMARSRKASGGWSADNADAATVFGLSDARARVTRWLGAMLLLVAVVVVLGLVDTLGATIYKLALASSWSVALISLVLPLFARFSGVRKFLDPLIGDSIEKWKPSLFAILALLGLAAGFALLVALSVLAHGVVHGFAAAAAVDWRSIGVAVALLGLCTGTFGRTWVFVNSSSHAQIYASRLARAFLGASNPRRFAEGKLRSVTEPILGDDSNLPEYHEGLKVAGGPLHLINVTINQTTGNDSKTVVRDRKGIGMAVGPCGLSAGVRHHAVFPVAAPGTAAVVQWHANLAPVDRGDDFEMFGPAPEAQAGLIQVERLTLGQWIGISGAAFSTALGSRTSLGRSLFMALANVRLGYWWDAGDRGADERIERGWLRRALPVHVHLFEEITAKFRGPHARHWYLTDGGHFENMGGYELIRRRVPMIVIVDAEEDQDYIYEGFANLVRKARLDFNAEIEVLGGDMLDRWVHKDLSGLFGTLDQLKLAAGKLSERRAALATVRYDGSDQVGSLLLYLKPTMQAGDAADLHHYRSENPAFPQQPTFDQFFDEAQWESYRKLGETIAEQVFAELGDDDGGRFVPYRLEPVLKLPPEREKEKPAATTACRYPGQV